MTLSLERQSKSHNSIGDTFIYSFEIIVYMVIKQDHTILLHNEMKKEVDSDEINFRFTNTGHDVEIRDGMDTILEFNTMLGPNHNDLNIDIEGFKITNPDGSTEEFEELPKAIEHCKTKFAQYK